ncbi:MAG TPA: aspartate/glutamate racemase family protein [Burkholderiaceae bacterium]|nr:aspartate/glutamate racemase family protein [Burkholderiaceae bacterium]
MRRLLLINPNTSEEVSELLQSHARRIVGSEASVDTFTARFGAPYISCEASYAVAGHAVLDTWARALASSADQFDAVLIGCFGDPGLMALRQSSLVPVRGLAEASFAEAAKLGRFVVVTGGERWKPILERLAHSLGLEENLGGIHTVEQSGAQLAQNPAAAQVLLAQACIQAAEECDAKAIILGGAGLAGIAALIQPSVPVPIIDSVEAGVRATLDTLSIRGVRVGKAFEFAWRNVSLELAATGNAD